MSIDDKGLEDESIGSSSGMEKTSPLYRSSRSLIVLVTLAKVVSLSVVHGRSAQRANFWEKDCSNDFSISEQTISSSSRNRRVLANSESFNFNDIVPLLKSLSIINDDIDDDKEFVDNDDCKNDFFEGEYSFCLPEDDDAILQSDLTVDSCGKDARFMFILG